MKDRPILFSGAMVRALLAGTKVQTRRVVKLPADARGVRYWATPSGRSQPGYADPGVNWWNDAGNHLDRCPYGQPGDRLWVREAFRITTNTMDEARALTEDIMSGTAIDWKADSVDRFVAEGLDREAAEAMHNFERWRPSIHMPRWASRITLEITGVRVERLNDISEADARAEGIEEGSGDFAGCFWCGASMSGTTAKECYSRLWEQINGPGSWAANPWVWVIEFRRVVPCSAA